MRIANWPITGLMVTATLVLGCGDDKGTADSGMSSETAGEEENESETETDPGAWEFDDVIGVINSDDDDETDKRDWQKVPFEADDDIVTWTMPAEVFAGFGEGDTVRMTLTGNDLDRIRWWHETGGGGIALGHDVMEVHETYSFTPSGDVENFLIEFDDYKKTYTITVEHLGADGSVVATYDVSAMSAPLIMNHHLQPAEHVWAVVVNSNPAFINSYYENLGANFSGVAGDSVGFDVWIQDEIEFATSTAPNGQRTEIIIDSIRDRGLDNFPDQITEPDRFKQTWGNPGSETTYDSFGNLEASPPVTVDGVEYPFGRIYYGKTQFEGLNDILANFLKDQTIQAPVEMDTSWLCVAHVDEFSSFVPDPSSPKGFKALMADVDSAWELLEAMDPATELPRYNSGHGFPTVGSIVNDPELRALNEEIMNDHMEPIIDQFKAEFGLTEDDIIRIPTLFEEVNGCGGRVVALMPGMVNLIVANFEGETSKLFIPDPFLRTNDNDPASDPLLNLFADLMPEGNESIFVDNWQTYHLALGEVHCGTNVTRTPIANWWEVGQHLL